MRRIYDSIKQVSGLFIRSLRYLFFLEVLFKLIGAIIVFPLCEMLLHLALRFTKIYYISAQNYKAVLSSPVLLVSFLFIALILLMFLAFEVSCLAIAYQQTYHKQPIGWYQLVKEGLIRALRLFRPKNWLLFPFLIVLFPTLLYFIQNSSNNYVNLIRRLLLSTLASFPYNLIVIVLLVIIVLLAIFGMFSFQYYISAEIGSREALKRSRRLMMRHFAEIMAGILLWLAFLALILFVLNWVVYAFIRLGVGLFAEPAVQRGLALTIYHYVSIVLNFVGYSFFSFAGYAFVASFFYRNSDPALNLKSKAIIRKKDPKAKFRSGLSVGAMVLSIGVTFLVNLLLMYSVNRSSLINSFFSEKVSIISHRGYTAQYAENTLGAFSDAIDARADFIELDVQLTADDEVAVHHDVKLSRCWGLTGTLRDYTSEELSEIVDKDGQHLPLLREVFELCKDESINLVIELKVNAHNRPDDLTTAVMKLIEEYEFDNRCIIQSFSYDALKTVKSLNPNIACGYLMNGSIGMYYDLEAADFFSVNLSYMSESIVQAIHARGKQAIVWTVNNKNRMEEATGYHVDGIITDEPIRAREVIYGDNVFIENLLPEDAQMEPEE